MTEYTLVRELSKVYDALYDKLDGSERHIDSQQGDFVPQVLEH